MWYYYSDITYDLIVCTRCCLFCFHTHSIYSHNMNNNICVYMCVCVCVRNLRYMFTNIYTPTDETNENFTISHPSMCMCTMYEKTIICVHIIYYKPYMIIEIWRTQYLHKVKQNSNKVFFCSIWLYAIKFWHKSKCALR
jgi:hypothetical protein